VNGSSALIIGTALSGVVHLATGGGLYGVLTHRAKAPIVAELDLSLAPVLPRAPNVGGGRGKPSEKWVLPKKHQKAKAPAPPAPEKVETKEEVQKQESAAEGGKDLDPNATGDGGGGTGAGEGEYIPAEAASRQPRWIGNFISSRDYPVIARQEGKDGRVTLTVLIDRDGRVRDVRLLQGSDEVLNRVALEKVAKAIFSPAYNDAGKAVACKVTLPIRFELH
jgi:periplasmic protein TonB